MFNYQKIVAINFQFVENEAVCLCTSLINGIIEGLQWNTELK
jgi:hypothetical protein